MEKEKEDGNNDGNKKKGLSAGEQHGSSSLKYCKPAPSVIKLPEGVKQVTYDLFCHLPIDDSECARVDVEKGLFYICAICDGGKPIRTREGRPFTLIRWKEHKKNKGHQIAKKRKDNLAVIKLKKKKSSGKLTKLEKAFLKSVSSVCFKLWV